MTPNSRDLPHSAEAEAYLLSCILLDGPVSLSAAIESGVSPETFFVPAHALIYGELLEMSKGGNEIAIESLAVWLQGKGQLNSIGGHMFLVKLTETAPTTAQRSVFIARLRDLEKLRYVIKEAGRAVETCFEGGPEALESAQKALTKAQTKLAGTEGERVKTLAEAAESAAMALESPLSQNVCPTAWPAWDRLATPLKAGEMITIAARPGMGKAQPLTAKILTPSGWKRMGDLSVGDKITSHDGRDSIVTGVFPQGERTVYRVTMSDGRSTECCAEHLWRVRYRDWKEPRILTTEKLIDMLSRIRYKNRLSVDLFCGEFGVRNSLPLDAWFLGYLLGNGDLCGNTVRVSTRDDEVIARIASLLPPKLMLKKCGAYDYRITAGKIGGLKNPVTEILKFLGVYHKYSHEKFIPKSYLDAEKAVRLSLLRGLMDSDGWAEKGGTIRYSSASRQLAEDVCYLVRSLGGICSIAQAKKKYTHKGKKLNGRISYLCQIRMMQPKEAFTVQRKIDVANRIRNTMRLNFSSIEAVRVAAVQCISVSHPSELYITDDFTVTHNTALALQLADKVALSGSNVLIYSLEMMGEELATRLALQREGRTALMDSRKRAQAIRKVGSTPSLHVFDARRTYNMDAIEARARVHSLAKGGVGLIVIDYLQLIVPTDRRTNREQQVAEMSRRCKQMAGSVGCPVIVLAQLNREAEKRARRPILSDLRESGAIEQDSDRVWFIHQDEKDRIQPDAITQDVMLIQSKCRGGPPNVAIKLKFDMPVFSFTPIAHQI